MSAGLLNSIEQSSFFTAIRDSAYAYPVLLWLHLLGLAVWCGMMLATDLRLLGLGFGEDAAAGILKELRRAKLASFVIAAACGLLLFGAKAAEYAYNPWFWGKLLLLALLAVKGPLFRSGQVKAAAALSLVLWMGAIGAARGPATVKDVMHSMVDPAGDFLFASVQQISDENGIREVVPETDQQWADVHQRLENLHRATDFLSQGRLRAARPRDRSQNPGVENEPAEVQALLDAKHQDFLQRARRLRDAAGVAMRAVDAKDKDALSQSLVGIDQACEVCHLLYWYPKDARAREAARESGILP